MSGWPREQEAAGIGIRCAVGVGPSRPLCSDTCHLEPSAEGPCLARRKAECKGRGHPVGKAMAFLLWLYLDLQDPPGHRCEVPSHRGGRGSGMVVGTVMS